MSRAAIAATALIAAAAAALLAGCQTAAPVGGIEPAQEPGTSGEPLVDPSTGIPEECLTVAVGWFPGITVDTLEHLPADWPAPPADAILCATSSGGTIETASYATGLGFDELAAHYQSAFGAGTESAIVTGEENGTGYATVDGRTGGIAFQISERDGGYTMSFAPEAS